MTLGLRYDRLDLQDALGFQRFDVDDEVWSPQLGVRWQLTPTTVLRGAIFRNLRSHDRAQLAPQLLAGFALRRAETAADTVRDEGQLALSRQFGAHGYIGVGAYHREVESPVFRLDERGEVRRFKGASEVDGARLDGEIRLSTHWTASGRLEGRRIQTSAFDQRDTELAVALHFIHHSGWRATFEPAWIEQSYSATGAGLPETSAVLFDVSVRRELRGKRVRLGLEVLNAFDEEFNVVIEGLSVVERLPVRRVNAFLELNF